MTQPMQLPAYLQNKTSRGVAQALSANLGAGSPPFLSIQGNRFTLIDAAGDEIPVATYDPKIGPYIDCAVIDALERTSKIYYDKPFDPGANQYEPPACFSDNGVAPSRNAAKPQSPTCAACPQGAWGSKVSQVSGKPVKACNDVQKIAILVPGYEMPFLVRVPPNSRTNFRNYVNKFVGQPIDIADVLTRFTFEPGGIGTLHFDAVGYIDEATFSQREKLLLAKATDAMVGRTDLPRQEALSAPTPAQQIEAQPAASIAAPFLPVVTQITVGTPTAAVPAVAQDQQQRRRRRSAQEPSTAASPQPATAPFLPGAAAPAVQVTGGIDNGAAPPNDLAATLNNLFGQK